MTHRLKTLYPSSTARSSIAILTIDVIRILDPADTIRHYDMSTLDLEHWIDT